MTNGFDQSLIDSAIH
jgi:Zn-dependent M16 (insulinase) family peptidase